MKVLEIKNNLVKISNEQGSKLILGGFVVIEDDKTPYVGQIVSLKADNGISYAIARLVFTFNEEGIVKNYDGTIPSLDAAVSLLAPADLLDILPIKTPVKLGNLAQQDFTLNVDSSLLESNLLICSDSAKNTATIVMNFAKQLENNAESSIIFDIDGKFRDEKKFVFGENFKMPLNFESINFIYANDLNDVDATSKAVIQDIFLEVQEYTRTIPERFIPFDTFINVVEQQYKESNIPELALLRNKLLKYREEKVFAQSKYELSSLKEYIKDNYTVILDISKADAKLQKEIITYVYTVIEEMGNPITTFVKINDDNSDKKLIKMFLSQKSAHTNIICNHNYKYVYELKEQADNLILFIPETTRHDFASYNTFLNKLNHDEYIIWGKVTQRIPLIVELRPLVIKKEEPIRITMDEPLPAEEKEPLQEEHAEENAELSTEESHPAPPAGLVIATPPEVKTEDFTDNEDTYTDLSDDIERIKPEEEDYSALKEEEPVEEIPEEDDFDRELESGIEESLEESLEDKEASTNDFFTETKLQEIPEAVETNKKITEPETVIEEIPEAKPAVSVEGIDVIEGLAAVEEEAAEEVEEKIPAATEVTAIEELEGPVEESVAITELNETEILEEPDVIQDEDIPNEIQGLTFDESPLESKLEEEINNEEVIINETVSPETDEAEITSISAEEFMGQSENEPQLQEEQIVNEEFDEAYEEGGYSDADSELQLNEDILVEENLSLEETALEEPLEANEENIILPDPSIDERIEEDLPDVEAIFEELPPDVEVTPYENTLVQKPAQLMPDDEELREQVAKEIDENFIYNKIKEDNLTEEDSLTEDDLNFIDDMNNTEVPTSQHEDAGKSEANPNPPKPKPEPQPQPEPKAEEVPVYAAKMPVSNQKFEQGDHVAHPKYGEGIVEKMIKYGDKTLCSINFANVGRRLLDPAISEISLL